MVKVSVVEHPERPGKGNTSTEITSPSEMLDTVIDDCVSGNKD